MSNYVNRDWIEARIPPQTLLEALDDNADGTEDDGLFTALAVSVSGDVDSLLGTNGDIATALRTSAANVFFCSLIYKRRGIGDAANPWANEAKSLTKKLEAVASGAQRAEPAPSVAAKTISIVSEPAKTHSMGGRLIL
jgi:hypothetical protein